MLSQTGNVIADTLGDTTTTVAALATEEILDIATEDDEVDEADGTIIVTLLMDTNTPATYIKSTDTEAQSAVVAVTDDDEPQGPPVVTLSSESRIAYEADSVNIVVSLDRPAPINGLNVNYSIDEVGDHLNPFIASFTQVFIPAGETSTDIIIVLDEDDVKEPDGSFTISLVADSTYELGDVSSITLETHDINEDPTFWFEEPKVGYGADGAYAVFTLGFRPRFSDTRLVNLLITGVNEEVESSSIPNSILVYGNQNRYRGKSYVIDDGFVRFRIPVPESQIREQTGQVSATILPPDNPIDYSVVDRYKTESIDISDFAIHNSISPPIISVSSITEYALDFDDYIFKITASKPSATPLEINYYYNTQHNVGSGNIVTNSIILPAGATDYEMRAHSWGSTHAEKDFNFDGYINFYIEGGPNYLVAPSPNNHVYVETKRFTDSLGLSIIGNNDIFESASSTNNEPETAQFRITAPTVSEIDRIINIEVSEGDSDFLLVSGRTSIVLPAGQSKVYLEVPIVSDEIDEPDGVITAKLLPGNGYTVASTRSTATVTVYDDDGIPEVRISNQLRSPLGEWYEGKSKSVKFYVSGLNPSDHRINLRITDDGSNIYNGPEFTSTPWDGNYTSGIEISTNIDRTSEEDRTIKVEVLPGNGYIVSPAYSSHTFTVYNIDHADSNKISIEALDTIITEGQYAKFRLTPNVKNRVSYQAYFTYSDGDGDFVGELYSSSGIRNEVRVEGPSRGSIQISNWDHSRIIAIPTVDDNIDEADGSITLTLIPNPLGNNRGYEVYSDATKNSVSIAVLDNDEAPVLPEVSISATKTTLIEGETTTLTLTSTEVAPTSGLLVNYQVTENGNFFANSFSRPNDATILAGESTIEVDFITQDDNLDEADGSFTISLANGTGYTIGSNSSIIVNVADNDELPELSIAPVTDSVVESNPAQFRITTPTASQSQLTVKIHVAQTGNVIAGCFRRYDNNFCRICN